MEAPSYTDTILLQANRKSSAEYLSGNNESKSSWTNDLGAGIKLDIGDTISVHSAYISEIGNEEATIEIKGKKAINNLGQEQKYISTNVTLVKTEGELSNGIISEVKTSEGNYSWEYTVDKNVVNTINDNEINITHSYYKCAQGDNYITLPRKWGANDRKGWFDGSKNWSQYDSFDNGKCYSINPYRLGTDYSDIRKFGQKNGYGFSQETDVKSDNTTISHDGRRFTLFVRKSFKNYVPDGVKTGHYLQGERDPAMMDFIWYKKTVKYNVSLGFNSPANVASQITNKMTDTIKIENISLGEDNDGSGSRRDGQIKQNNLNLEAQSNTYEIFPCATAWFLKNAGELWFNDNYTPAVRVPVTRDDPITLKNNQNCFSLNFSGAFGGSDYNASQYFTDGVVRTGWKCLKFYNTSTNTTISQYDFLKGSPICNVREFADDNDKTSIGFDVEYTGGDHTINNPTLQTYAFEFTNEHIPILYESCYSTVGYLRPEIQEAGREFNAGFNEDDNITIDGSFHTLEMSYPMTEQTMPLGQEGQPSVIVTRIPWTDENLLALKKLFEAQGLYPELFDYDGMSASQKELINVTEETKDNVSVDKMRFLHMNDNTQETDFSYTAEITSDIVDGETGEYIPSDDVTDLRVGMRIYKTDIDTDDDRLFPPDTFITSITGNNVFVSNSHNTSLDVTSNLPFTIFYAGNGLGSDRYTNGSGLTSEFHTAGAVFFDYNPARKDISTGEGSGTVPYETLTYGFARKVKYFTDEYIGFTLGKYQSGTLPEAWFAGNLIRRNRCIGFDKHFNAFSTGAILLTNGEASPWGGDYNASWIEGSKWSKPITGNGGDTLPDTDVGTMFRCFNNQPTGDGWYIQNASGNTKYGPTFDDPNTARIFNEIYCGANQPALQFDGASSRFSFVNLHTPERIGTDEKFVNNASDVADDNLPCYKLNKRLDRLNYSPDFIPYNNVFKVANASELPATPIVEKDNSIAPYSIMDAQSGIFIEDYGCDEKNWEQSLWELLGFTYKQFHNVGSRLQRLTNTGLTTSTPTTNALIKTEDLQNLVKVGSSGLPKTNTLNVNYPYWRYSPNGWKSAEHFSNTPLGDTNLAFPGNLTYPVVAQQAVSTNIEADNLPRKMLSPVYLIKTDLLNPKYIGGREGTSSLPIIGVVDKSSGYGDFYTGATNSNIFTNTIPRTIQNIKTSIVDADGSESRVDDSCCVIYKVTKQIRNNSVVLQNMLNPPKK
jgi:hypothetical protein